MTHLNPLKPASILGLAFLLLGARTVSAQSIALHDQVFLSDAEQPIYRLDLFPLKTNRLSVESFYGHWVQQKKQSLISRGNTVSLNYHSHRFAVRLEQQFQKHDYQNLGENCLQHYQSRQDFQNSALSFQSLHWLVALWQQANHTGGEVMIRPVHDFGLFFKRFSLYQQHFFKGNLSYFDNEDFLSQPVFKSYDLALDFKLNREISVFGGQWQLGHQGILHTEMGINQGDSRYSYTVFRSFLLNQFNIHLSYEFTQHNSQSANLMENETVQGKFGLNTEYERLMFKLSKKSGQLQQSIYAIQYRLENSVKGSFNAGRFGGYFSSLLVGLGVAQSQLGLDAVSAGWQLQKNSDWQYQLGLEVSDIQLKAPTDYRVYSFPVGVLNSQHTELDIQRVRLLQLSIGLGYQWKRVKLFYQMKQLLPIEIQRRASVKVSQPTNPGSGANKGASSSFKFDRLPDGNLQTLTLEYQF